MRLKFGPSGLGPTKDAINNLVLYNSHNLTACEIAFTYGVYIKEQDAKEIKDKAEELNISMSIHAQYFVNLNAKDKTKLEASKKRILDCCERANQLGAKNIIFHAGFYAGIEEELTFQNIKTQIIELQKIIKKKNWDVKLCPEVMGKKNVFGSIDEISRLVKETGCSFCIDFAHILARYDKHMFKEVIAAFPQEDWHCHFSGIEYSVEKGEKKHKKTLTEEWQNLISNLKNLDKNITIINESPDQLQDSIDGLKIYNTQS
jgi:deoxyribonuclease IV